VAKAELFKIPVLNWILKGIEIIPVKRGMSDVTSFKECLRVLRNGELLLIFPEGTRVKAGKTAAPHSGAVVMAARAGVPVMPVYIGRKKRLFRKTDVVFGEPYQLEFEGRKPTHEESQRMTEELMARICALGEE
jgi:1-acyl-sn-glycerol-3-phosphate acyltransferase